MVICIYNTKYTQSWEVPLICVFFIVQATIPRPSQRHISLGLHISVPWLPTKLPSFLYSEHYLSFSNLFQCSTFSWCPRFFSFLHQYVAQHNPTLLSNKMALSHWNINCFQNTKLHWGSQESSEPATLHAVFWSERWDLGNSLNNFPINANFFTGVTAVVFCARHKPGFGWTGLLCIANQSWRQWKHSFE